MGRYDYVQLPNGARRKRMTKDEVDTLEDLPRDWKVYSPQGMLSSGYTPTCIFDFDFRGTRIVPPNRKSWRTNPSWHGDAH